jgi:hypothetical protein
VRETTEHTADLAARLRSSSAALIAANLLPLGGVLFRGWDVFLVMALFWLENVAIGLFAIAKIVASGSKSGCGTPLFSGAAPVDGEFHDPVEALRGVVRLDLGVAALGLFLSHA